MASSAYFSGRADANKLLNFVQTELQLSAEEKRSFNRAVDSTVRFLQSPSDDFPWSIKRVVKSGSLSKDTAVRGHVDVDLVCFIEKSSRLGLDGPEDFLRLKEEIIADIAAKLRKAYLRATEWRLRKLSRNEYLVNLKLMKSRDQYSDESSDDQSKDQSSNDQSSKQSSDVEIKVDVIVAFDLFEHFACGKCSSGRKHRRRCPLPKIYAVFKQNPRYADEFSPSLAEMQLRFVENPLRDGKGENLKKLIMLIKFWVKTEVKPLHDTVYFPSYLVELACIGAWRAYFRNENEPFDLAAWFQKMMQLFINYRLADCRFKFYYKYKCIPTSIALARPLIMDPANPFNNVADNSKVTWLPIVECAKKVPKAKWKRRGKRHL